MKHRCRTRILVGWLLSAAGACALAADENEGSVLPQASGQAQTATTAFTARHSYDSVEGIRLLQRVEATVVRRTPCTVEFQAENGTLIILGSPAADPRVASFLP